MYLYYYLLFIFVSCLRWAKNGAAGTERYGNYVPTRPAVISQAENAYTTSSSRVGRSRRI